MVLISFFVNLVFFFVGVVGIIAMIIATKKIFSPNDELDKLISLTAFSYSFLFVIVFRIGVYILTVSMGSERFHRWIASMPNSVNEILIYSLFFLCVYSIIKRRY
jgi:hypothetical protein